MLVLTRQVDETIVIDGTIRITVVSVKGNKVRMAINAPPQVPVDREEIHERRAQFGASPRPARGLPPALLHTVLSST
jgi:carbon storage regulator